MLQEGEEADVGAPMTEALFGGVLSSQVACEDCGHKAVTLEPFYSLSLPVPSRLRADARSAEPPCDAFGHTLTNNFYVDAQAAEL